MDSVISSTFAYEKDRALLESFSPGLNQYSVNYVTLVISFLKTYIMTL